jgi:hypothetical protein
MNPLHKIFWIGKGVGWDNVPRRVYQSAMIRSGALRRRMDPARFSVPADQRFLSDDANVYANWKSRRRRFFPIPTSDQLRELVAETTWTSTVGKECERALNGHYPFFSHWTGELGWPPNFNRDPVNQIDWPVGQHWLDTARSGPPRDDIKLVWEASRFTLAYTLARHYVYTQDDKWANAFWEMFDAWRQQNPVNLSVAWGCGQEVAFRIMAVLFAALATLDSEAATPARLKDLELFCYESALRIEGNVNYARSQKNNHALSEGLGLWTIGLLFPNFPRSASWSQRGRKVLEQEIHRQLYHDGSYVQHSMSYHRVMLDNMCWAIELGRINHQELSESTVARVAAATRWIAEFIEPDTGRVPNYGANDGANVLPLSCSDYLDYRPSCQLAAKVCRIESWIPSGVWSEKSLWITGESEVVPSKVVREDRWVAPDGGYFIMRGPQSQLMTRATSYRDRPTQCDALHVDLWYQKHNVLRDAGSFRYYHADKRLKDYFYSTAAHNTVSVEGTEQMTKGPNFLWLNWPTAQAEFDTEGNLICRAEFSSNVPYTHTRTISRKQDTFTVLDAVSGVESYSLNWRLTPHWQWQQTDTLEFVAEHEGGSFHIRIKTDEAVNARLVESWESLYYGERTQVPQLVIQGITGTISTQFEPCPQ